MQRNDKTYFRSKLRSNKSKIIFLPGALETVFFKETSLDLNVAVSTYVAVNTYVVIFRMKNKVKFTAQSIHLLWLSFLSYLPIFFMAQIPKSVQLSTGKIKRIKLQYRLCQCIRCEFCRSTTGALKIPLSTGLSG